MDTVQKKIRHRKPFVRTPEHCRRISEGLKGNKNTKGRKLSDETKRKIGLANSVAPHPCGEKNSNWKGDDVGISGVHCWIKKQRGLARNYICEICRKKPAHDWSNVDHEYKRNLCDYHPLCVSCHRKYDFKHKLPKNYTKDRNSKK